MWLRSEHRVLDLRVGHLTGDDMECRLFELVPSPSSRSIDRNPRYPKAKMVLKLTPFTCVLNSFHHTI